MRAGMFDRAKAVLAEIEVRKSYEAKLLARLQACTGSAASSCGRNWLEMSANLHLLAYKPTTITPSKI